MGEKIKKLFVSWNFCQGWMGTFDFFGQFTNDEFLSGKQNFDFSIKHSFESVDKYFESAMEQHGQEIRKAG